MEQSLLMNQSGLQSLESHIGVQAGDAFIVDDDCLDVLAEIEKGLNRGDAETCLYRLQLHSYGIVTKHLVAVVMFLDAEENELLDEKQEIFYAVLRLLARLSQSLDVLTSELPGQVEHLDPEGYGHAQGAERITRLWILRKKIHTMVTDLKNVFLTSRIVEVIFAKFKETLEELSDCEKLDETLCDALNDTFYLLRNLLYSPDQPDQQSEGEMYQQSEGLVKLLMQAGLQKLVLFCTNSLQQERFALSLVQLLAAVFNNSKKQCIGGPVGATDGQPHSMTSICESEEDLSTEEVQHSELLHEFAKNLMQQGCPNMLFHVKKILLGCNEKRLEPVYYLWLFDFCLNRALLYKMPFETVRCVVSQYSVDYLVYLGVTSLEKMFIHQKKGANFSTSAMHLSLVIKGMTDFFAALKYYRDADLQTEEKHYLNNMQCLLAQSYELRQSILLFLRCYQSDVHDISHLVALVGLNHSYLIMVEKLIDGNPGLNFFDMEEHIKSYATQAVIQHYSEVLSEAANGVSTTAIEQVFTMLHHIGIDLGHGHLLLQMQLLQAMSALESSPKCHSLSRRTVWLMRFALEKFYEGLQNDPKSFFKVMVHAPVQTPLQLPQENCTKERDHPSGGTAKWSVSEVEQLQDLCVQGEEEASLINYVVEEMQKLGVDKDEEDIAEQMSRLGWCTDTDTLEESGKSVNEENTERVDTIIQKLVTAGYQHQLAWLHKVLLEMVYVRLGGMRLGRLAVEEPVTMHCLAQGQDMLLVPYTETQEKALQHPDYWELLENLGLNVNADQLFPRIPHSWDVETLLQVATRIQPVDYGKCKFVESDLSLYSKMQRSEPEQSATSDMDTDKEDKAPMPQSTSAMWMLYVKSGNRFQSKMAAANGGAAGKGGGRNVTPWWKK